MNIPPPTITPTLNLQALETSLLLVNNSIQNTTESTIFNINAQYLTDFHTILEDNSFHNLNVPISNDQAVPKIYVDTKVIVPSAPDLSVMFKETSTRFGGSSDLVFSENNLILNGTLFTTNITSNSLLFKDKILIESSEYLDSNISMKLPNTLPNSNVALRTNGLNQLEWTTLTSSSGLQGYVQFNDSGVFGSDSTFNYSSNDKTLTVENIQTNQITSTILRNDTLDLEGTSGQLTLQAPLSLITSYSLTLPNTSPLSGQILSVYENQLYWSNNGTVNNNISEGILYNHEQSFETSSQFTYSDTNKELTISNLINTDSPQNIVFSNESGIIPEFLRLDGNYNKIFINNNYVYLIGEDSISKYSLLTSRIYYLTSIYLNDIVTSMDFDNNYLYSVSSSSSTYSIVNKIEINSFTTVVSKIISGTSNNILVEQGLLYVVGEQLNILDSNLQLISNITLNGIASKVLKNDNYLLISTNNEIFSLNTYDISNVYNPILVKYLSLGVITDMYMTNNELYTGGTYLNKLSIQKPEEMTLLKTISLPNSITTIDLINNDLFVLTDVQTCFIINAISFQTKLNDNLNVFPNNLYRTFVIYGSYMFIPVYYYDPPSFRYSSIFAFNIYMSNFTSTEIGNIKSQTINCNTLDISGIYSSDNNVNTNILNTDSVSLYEPNSVLEYSFSNTFNNILNSNSGTIVLNDISFTTETKILTISNNKVSPDDIIILKVYKWNKVNTVLITNVKNISEGSFVISIKNVGQVTTSPGNLELFFVIE